ncbi:MAG: MATE family efflux transporter [Roseibium sp.]|uniref:MATE family efflux transporter n=1 Tax=Roseibium sp. TaxID=1936156 RepID=UPI002604983B|nr:MATE family efflux transporter [Roseibium sp.]MCV0426700.1 MATE family efflux transporter [Roseibium sp.]
MSQDTARPNAFTHGPPGLTLLKTALPIILVMSMNGFLTVADAIFLGIYVGADALSAVTLMFPAYMLLAALATLVANGMASVLARALGGNRTDDARAAFAGAHGLALCFSAAIITLFLLFGRDITYAAADGSARIAGMSYTYLAITIWSSPLLFVLSVNADALRSEGRIGLMAGTSVFVSLANIAFNFVLVAVLDFGVAGSAYGTVLAQLCAMSFVVVFRSFGQTLLRPTTLLAFPPTSCWPSILALGAPQSLSFIGIALGSSVTFAALQLYSGSDYANTVAAFGVITRIMTFFFLPLLGLSQALQAMIGNNFGARLWERSDVTLRLGLISALVYCLGSQVVLSLLAHPIGMIFVEDTRVAEEMARILPVMVAMYFAAGPLLVISTYFQAIGDAKRAALLSLLRPYCFFLPAVLLLPAMVGEWGIWLAGPVSDVFQVALVLLVLMLSARKSSLRWGLFRAASA